MKNSLKKFRCRPSTFCYICPWLSGGENFLEKLSSTDKCFTKKCPWISEGNFTLDPELFKKSVLGDIEKLKSFLSARHVLQKTVLG